LLGLYYFNWAGTLGELKEYIGKMKSICDGIKGVELKGVYTPTSEWNYVFLLEMTSYDKGLEVLKTYMKKHGHPKYTVGKVEIFHTLEELGMTP